MMMLSRKIQQIEESHTLALTAKAKRMKEEGIDVISLTAGEPDFPTPRHVKEAAIRAIEADFTHYTANQGIRELVEAIIHKFSSENDLHFSPRQILVSNGAKHSIYNALQAICRPGDEVVFFSPYWVSYPAMVRLADATPVVVPTRLENGFSPDPRGLRRAINQRTKAIILNSPGNPTGAVYPRSLLEEIAAIVKETGVFVISDEIYEKVIYNGAMHFSIGSVRAIRDQVITVNGVSKAYAMTGWRIGYMGGPEEVIAAAGRLQSQVSSNANSIAQKATVAALGGSQRDIDMMVEEFHRRRDAGHALLKEIRGVDVPLPAGAFYFLFSVAPFIGREAGSQRMKDTADIAAYLLDHHHVATVPGSAFGAPDCLRISYACAMDDLEQGVRRLRRGLEELH